MTERAFWAMVIALAMPASVLAQGIAAPTRGTESRASVVSTQPKPGDGKPIEVKAGEVKSGEGKSVESRPGENKPARAKSGSAFGNFGTSKEPVRIDAASLQVVDKEQKAIYSGDVVAVQGATTLRCSKLTIFYTQSGKSGEAKAGDSAKAAETPPPAEPARDEKPKSAATGGSSIKKLDCTGPVSVVSATQTATGDHGVFESDRDLVTLTGNVVLADCENVQRGDKLVYNTKTGIANVTNAGNGRVQGVFTPGSDDKAPAAQKQPSCRDKK